MSSNTHKTAIVPGTFDPITSGHIDIIQRAALIFDDVIVAVAESYRKKGGTLFELNERVKLAEEVFKDSDMISVLPFDGLLVDFAHAHNAHVIVKGLRAMTDFEAEFQMAQLNYHFDSSLETIFIMSTPNNMYLSSSAVRELAVLKGNIEGLVPEPVGIALSERFGCSYKK